MDKEFFMNASMPPPLQFDHPFSGGMPTWQSISSAMEIQSSQSPDCFLSPHPAAADHFESARSSMVSSPGASGSAAPNDNFMIRELIGKLGSICNSGDIHSGGGPPSLPPYIGGGGGGGSGGAGGSCSTNNSCYNTPLSSPPKMGMPIVDHLMKDNFPTLGNSIALSSNLPAMPGDPGFAARAARFSSFGSRSFNGRTSQFVANNNNNAELAYRSNSNLGGNGKLQRVLSSPSLKAAGSQAENNNNSFENSINERQRANLAMDQGELSNSRENSSISGQNPGGENAPSRKRKAAPKGKAKESQSPLLSNSNRVAEIGDDSIAKRSKSEEGSGEEDAKTEENRGEKQSNSNQKPPEAPKDYIHVRARRGQATDSHSLAERVRREKISERMKLLQDLVPGCNKVTGKALMLDEIINYVQSLQRQVEFLSMKLSSVNPRLDSNMDNLFSKDAIQPNCSLQHPMYPIDSLAPTLYGQHHQNQNQNQNPLQNNLTTGGPMAPCSMDPLNASLNQNHGLQLHPIDGFPNGVPQLSSLCEGDLQSIVQMSYGQKENGYQSQPLHGTNQTPLMKIEF